jgi:hypothetical protein
MKRDLMMVVGGLVATGITMWGVWGNPPKHSVPRLLAMHQLDADPAMKAISERSPYMRSER